MVLPVYLYGHPVLRREAEDIDKDYPDLKKLIADMFETMYKTDGIGIAAPQVGKSIAVIVIDASPLAEDFPECADSKMVLINPTLDVIEDESPVSRAEGCLSLPGQWAPRFLLHYNKVSVHLLSSSQPPRRHFITARFP